jgi:Ca2+-binding RTX toxin-like protein
MAGMNTFRRISLALPAIVAAAAVLAAPASAKTGVLADQNALLIHGDDEANTVTVDPFAVSPGKPLRVVGGLQTPFQLFQGCAFEPGATEFVDCASAPKALAVLDAGADTLTVNADLPLEARGGYGIDKITGGTAADLIEGNAGDDVLDGSGGNDSISDGDRPEADEGRGGNDTLKGGAGNDQLDAGPLPGGGAGADTLDGGADSDTLDYSVRTAPVSVTEGEGADDGEGGEGDNVANAETILGGAAGDSLAGAAEANTLRGGRGDDTLDGGGGADVLKGDAGSDTASYAVRIKPVTATLDGEPGDGAAGENDSIDADIENLNGGYEGDHLTGSTGANAITGAAGDDTLDGLGGDDVVTGGLGNDTIVTGTGSDVVSCGDGDDTVVADANDSVASDCEHVSGLPAVDNSGNNGGGTEPTGGTLEDRIGPAVLLPARLKVGRRRVASVRIGCPVGETCVAVRLTVKVDGKKLGSARAATIAAGSSRTLKLRLKRRPRRVTLVASAADAAGNRATVKRKARVAR